MEAFPSSQVLVAVGGFTRKVNGGVPALLGKSGFGVALIKKA